MPETFDFQMSYKLGPKGDDMLNVRGGTPNEFADNLREAGELVTIIKDLGEDLRAPATTGQAVQNLQAGGLNPTPVLQGQVIPPQPAQGYSAPPTPPPAPAPTPVAAQCPACSRNTACPDCGTATVLGVKPSKSKNANFNAHMCTSNERHRVVWCKTPIPLALQTAMGNPNLVYG